MKQRKTLTWPPRVGARICLDTGFASSSWSAEVRAIVDDDFAVVRRWRKHKGWSTYEVLEKLTVDVYNRDRAEPMFFEGPLPRARAKVPAP